MDYKLDYISKLLQKTSSKRIEHYVLSRIWHLLDNTDIKIVPQQYVSRQLNKYALTDIYFPQINVHVEINEPAHYDNLNIIDRDLKREQEIIVNTGHELITINCSEDLIGIHNQIDNLVSLVNRKVNKQKNAGTFKPWSPQEDFNPNYWKEKGKISILEEVTFRTIEDICSLFNADYQKTKRGFLRKGGIVSPLAPELFIWWPSESSRSGWLNLYDEDEKTITETNLDTQKTKTHYDLHVKGDFIRVVFYHYKDVLGFTNYKFLGVFKNDRNASEKERKTIWKREGQCLDLITGDFN